MSSPWDEEQVAEGVSNGGAFSTLPPLRLYHLMLWTAVASAIYAVIFSSTARDEVFLSRYALVSLIWFLPASAECAALIVLIAWGRRPAIPWQPGHGLLVLGVVTMLLSLVQLVAVGDLERGAGGLTLLNSTRRMSQAFSLVAPLLIAWAVWPCVWWRMSFLSLALSEVASFVIAATLRTCYFGYGYRGSMASAAVAQLLPLAVVTASVFGAIRTDARLGENRHWTHWVGVVALWLQLPITAAAYAYYLSLPEPSY